MGGKSLEQFGVTTRRVDRLEYFSLVSELVALTAKANVECFVPSVVSDKESFGDVDVVLDVKYRDHAVVRELLDNSAAVYRNGHCVSFEFKGVQVDFVFSPCPVWTYRWMSHGDASNLVGRVARKYGYKFGWDGFWLAATDELPHDVLVTDTHFYAVLEFLGFSPSRHQQGFQTNNDLFSWVVSSRYFEKEMFMFENRNAKDRVRDKKRPTYTAFLEYLENVKSVPTLMEAPSNYGLFGMFPKVKSRLAAKRNEVAAARAFAAKFNGNLVMRLTNLSGAELGKFMVHMKQYTNEMKSMTNEQVERFVREQYEKNK